MAADAAARSTRSAPSSSTPRLSIGQVLQRLGGEFPDLTSSKLRFFEEKGLLHPARSPSGYRKYSHDDVERIRRVLTMQRDLYLPLKVIGEYLAARDRGLDPELPGSRAPRTATMLEAGSSEFDRVELLVRTGASAALLDDAVSAGLIAPGSRFGADDATMLATLVELERSGIGPRHLRTFTTAARHELGLIEQSLPPSPRRGEPGGREQTAERAGELAELLATVRRTIVRQGLREVLGVGDGASARDASGADER